MKKILVVSLFFYSLLGCGQLKKENSNHTMKELMVNKYYLKEIEPLSKTYIKGDRGEEVIKIKEWLMLWQLDQNYVDITIDLNSNIFDDDTENLLKEVQKFMEIEPTGVLDDITWDHLVSPLKKTFDLNSYNQNTLREKIIYFATRHLQYRSSELDEDNLGPWIRSYMGYDGKYAYWCQALACIVLDQTFSSIGERFDEYYAKTFACEIMREHARKRGLLVTFDQLLEGAYIPQPGDQVLYLEGSKKLAHHTEIVYQVLDKEKGNMRTIGGNTNFSGSRNGVGTFIVDRNFIKDTVEIVKMLDWETINKHRAYPNDVRKLIVAYPDFVIGYEDNHIILKDGSKLLYDDGKKKTFEQLLTRPTIKDQFKYKYVKGTMDGSPKKNQDPGRITNEAFFAKMYGSTKEEVEKNLTEIVWCPKLSGRKIKVTKVNNIQLKLKRIGEEIDKYPQLKPFVQAIGGTFKWRVVKGTDRLSLHSYGIAIDINTTESNYWQWDCKCENENANLKYENRIPQLLVDIFEKYGFIWGGKWYHYDTMHFEYRPELLLD